uniref:DUF4209 domain-containing protein n=1 Tax=Timema monikensis TaxID=170555 RepID=A0A7R9EHQ2_9NEOP|nr:unnamed protein product [Timema monikensis]
MSTLSKEWKYTTIQSARQAFLEGLITGLKPPWARGPRFAMVHAGNALALLKVLSSRFCARKTQQMPMTKWMVTYMKMTCSAFSHKRFLAAPISYRLVKSTSRLVKVHWYKRSFHTVNAYGTSLALVLPHLEQLLRVIFCTVNNCQVRLLTAETTAFYTTLDEILAPTIVGAGGTVVNNMRSLLGDSIIELLEDMLTHQAGPRVRDKLSHGECDLLNIPPALTNHVICVALALMCRVNQILHQTNTYHLGKEELPDYLSDLLFNLQNAHTNDACKELCDKILSASTSYVSKFHPTALLRRDIVSVIKKLKFLKEVPQPEEALFLYNYSKDSLVCKDLLGFHNELYLTLKAFGNLDEVFSCEVLVKFVESMSVSTVYRPKLEGEVVSILRRIIDHAAIVSSQVKEVLCTKFLLYTNHKLRSRQRKTYHYMLNTAPSFSVALYCIVMIIAASPAMRQPQAHAQKRGPSSHGHRGILRTNMKRSIIALLVFQLASSSSVIQTFDEEDAVSIREAKVATSSSTVVSDLDNVKSYFGNLPGVIVSLEARNLPLIESVKIMHTIQEDVKQTPGPVASSVTTKLEQTCPVASAIYGFRDSSVLVDAEGYFGRL